MPLLLIPLMWMLLLLVFLLLLEKVLPWCHQLPLLQKVLLLQQKVLACHQSPLLRWTLLLYLLLLLVSVVDMDVGAEVNAGVVGALPDVVVVLEDVVVAREGQKIITKPSSLKLLTKFVRMVLKCGIMFPQDTRRLRGKKASVMVRT